MDEWSELRDNIHLHLSSRCHVSLPKYRPRLQLLVMPSFHDWWCIDLLETDGELSAYLIWWYATHDQEAFRNGLERLRHPRPFLPTLNSRRLERSSSDVREMLARFESIQLPFDLKWDYFTIDGTPIELRVGDQLVLEWNSGMPEEWPSDLRQAFSELRNWNDEVRPED